MEHYAYYTPYTDTETGKHMVFFFVTGLKYIANHALEAKQKLQVESLGHQIYNYLRRFKN